MRLVMREVPYDLYAVILFSTLLVASITLVPGLTPVRVVLGLPFILFFPGYVLISALYPEKRTYHDSDGRRVPGPTIEDGTEDDEGGGEGKGDLKDDAASGKVIGKGLDGLERVALSLGLSIAITPLIGLVLNWTYDWDPERLGIRLWLVLGSVYLFNLAGAAAAAYRRSRVPVEDRFSIELSLAFPKGGSPMDRFLTVGIAAMMLLSISLLVYIIVVPRQGEAFTEFYVLGPTGKADGYPSALLKGEERTILIGIGNHEHRDLNYTIVLSIDPSASNRSVQSLDGVVVSSGERPSMEVRVSKGGTLVIPCNFSIPDVGHHKLGLLLFKEGKEHRDLHLWVRVFEEGYLDSSGEAGLTAYIAGPGGDPSSLLGSALEGGVVGLSIGITNHIPEERWVNISIRLDDATASSPFPSSGPASISPGNGLFLEVRVPSGSSLLTPDLELALPSGTWELRIDVAVTGEVLRFVHPVAVGDGG